IECKVDIAVVIGRLRRSMLAAGAMWLAACGRKPTTLVVYNSHEVRRFERLECSDCTSFDVLNGEAPAQTYDTLVLDGHSLPPHQILGASLDRFDLLFEQTAPRLLVAITCHGAELELLEHFFAKSPRAEMVLASPEPLPWPGSTVDDDCLNRNPASPDCFRLP